MDRDLRRRSRPARAAATAISSRRGLRPNATAAISSMRASAMMTSGISSSMPRPSAKAAPEHEVVAVPEREHGRDPGADHVARRPRAAAACASVAPAHARGSAATAARRAARAMPASFQWSGLVIGAGPGEFRLARGVEHAPIGTDAAFERLPRLVDGFDDVVVDAEASARATKSRSTVGLLDAAGLGVLAVVAGARPAELGDHDALAGIGLAQLVVDDRSSDRPPVALDKPSQ